MRRHLLFVLTICSLPICTRAQTGFPPFGSFEQSGFDAVNRQNLNAVFAVPILSIPARGQSFQYSLVNNSLLWTQTGGTPNTWTPVVDASGNPTWGWSYGSAVAGAGQGLFKGQTSSHLCRYIDPDTGLQAYASWSITTYSNFAYRDWLGSVHPFNGSYVVTSASQAAQDNCGIVPGSSGPVSGYSTDNTGFYLSANNGTMSIVSPAGVNAGGAPVDTNGNYVSQTVVNSTETDWTDTAGHLALKVLTNTSNPNIQYEWQDSSGNYTAATSTTVQRSTLSIKTNFGCTGITEYTGTAILPTEIDLPNSQKYLITYEATPNNSGYYTGRVQRVTLPTGGYYEYDYSGANDSISCSTGSTTQMTRLVNDGTNTYTWSFSGSGSTTTVTAPQLPYDTAANNAVYTFSGKQQTAAQFYQGAVNSANLKRTVTTTWATNGTPATQITTLEDGHTENEIETSYDNFDNLLSLKEHDWGTNAPGAIVRTTAWTYLNSSPYISANILNRPTGLTISDGGGTVRFRTDVAYDESGYINSSCPSGAPQHNDTSYGCSYTTRGDPTTVTSYLAPATPANPVTKHFSYDSLGNTIAIKDPLNNTTTLSYSDSWGNTACTFSGNTYAYVTSVANPLSQATNFKYFSCNGLVYSATDANSQTTSLIYDSLNRPTQVNFPDGGQTALAYNSATSITTTAKMNSSQNIVSTQLLDGLGRAKQSQLNSDPQGVVYQDTTYDPLGRIYAASNPYRTTSDPTYGITTYRYDTLGRPTSVTLQDGSVTTASYAANTTTVTDPAGKKRQTTLDGLGRLSQITEDPSGLGYVTTYSYDALSNLMSVVQNGSRQRSFTFDAFSRLVCESNPEIQIATCPYPDNGSYTAGTIRYGYDSNGNLTSRQAPAPNQTGSNTVTTTYSYDALNRLTQKSYSDGTTPTAGYLYDVSSTNGVTISNPVGRLVRATTNNCIQTINSYDPMGRATTQWLNTPSYCGPASFIPGYSYDLAGDITSFANGIGVTFSYANDTAARPTQINSSLVDSQHPATLVSGLSYMPASAYSAMTLGNGYLESRAYNPRLQPTEIKATDGSGFLRYDFTYGYGSGGSNNGNLMSWNSTGHDFTFSRSYSYDSLNRVSTLSSPSDPNGCTGLSWTYDAWGNRTDQTVTGGSCLPFHQAVNTQNRLANSPYQYDAAGNMTNDGSHNYFYDAENRLVQVDGTFGTCSTATACYQYDAFGRRVEKATGSTTVDYVYDFAGEVTGEWLTEPGFSGQLAHYIYLNGQLVAEYKNSTTYFANLDHLGSTRLFTDPGGNGIQSWDYLPYGELLQGVFTTDHLFTGDERDSETNLDHTWFRKYSSNLGRWMTPDPAGLAAVDPSNPQSWNRFAYVFNDPVDFVDPLGLCDPNISICVTSTLCPVPLWCSSDGGSAVLSGPLDVFGGAFGDPSGRGALNPFLIFIGGRKGGGGNNSGGSGMIAGPNGPCTPSVFNPSCKPPSCLAVFFNAAGEADPLNLPAVPAGFGPDDAAKAAATALATKHIIERGLVVPLRSSIVRNILSAGEFAASAVVLVPAIYQLSVGLKAEYDARKARTCTTAFGN